uniref:Nuclear receptor domain-containing protein n=1 Tax=Macrostomum lignano TaxID=282301 RepID=A0A1I8H0F6_9PLAT
MDLYNQQQQQRQQAPKVEQFVPLDDSASDASFSLCGVTLSPLSASSYSPMPSQNYGGPSSSMMPQQPMHQQHPVAQDQSSGASFALPTSDVEAFQAMSFGNQPPLYMPVDLPGQPMPHQAASSCYSPPPPSVASAVSSDATGGGAGASASASSAASVSGGARRAKQREDKFCGVCGDKALGFNFDAVSCESCKAFFRRNAAKGVEALKCPYEGNCRIDISNRRFCKRCRLRKCFDVGMKKEYILTEEEKTEKRKKIDQNKLLRTLETLGLLPKELTPSELADREIMSESDVQELTQLAEYYRQSAEVRVAERHGQRAANVDDLINFAELSKLDEFRQLSQPDKVCLLKGGALELILLRGVISFDPDHARFLDETDTASAESDSMQGQDFLRAAGPMLGMRFFTRTLRSNLQCDHHTLVLLLACCLFSPDRAGLSPEGRDLVEESQVKYCMLLERLLRTRFTVSHARKVYPQLLTQLAELRGLEKDFSDLATMSNPRFVPPLMSEFLDLQDGGSGSAKHPQHRSSPL